jgi:iron complex transport system substrate-binding protein
VRLSPFSGTPMLAAVLLIAAGAVAGCGSSSPPAAAASASSSPAAAYPVTVTSCGVPVTYGKAPTRAVSNDINTTEDMLALGLESRMVGTFGVTGDGPVDAGASAVPGRLP